MSRWRSLGCGFDCGSRSRSGCSTGPLRLLVRRRSSNATVTVTTSLAWVFLLTLLVSYGDALRFFEEPCGSSRPKVINGQNEVIQAAAWMAAISNATYFLCVGTLINKHFVLAAAHCIYNHGDLFVKFETYPESEPPEMYAASLAVIHHSYVELDRSNDIGLLKLSRPVVYNVYIDPICLVLDKTLNKRSGQTFTAFSWDLRSKTYKGVTLNMLNQSHCNYMLGVNPSSHQICANSTSKQQDCDFQSSPLIISVRTKNKSHRGVIVGHGKIRCNRLGVFTDVTSYVDWITTTVKRFETWQRPVVAPPKTKIIKKPSHYEMVQRMWLYDDCSGNTLSSKLRAQIYGLNFMAQGVFITDRFIITNARGIPLNPDSLDVGVAGATRIYDEFRVDSIFKHPLYTHNYKNDIALLKLKRPVIIDGKKPICLIVNKSYQRLVESSAIFTTFDYVQTDKDVTIYQQIVDPFKCSIKIGIAIETNQVCVKTPPGVSQNYGKHGDILGKMMLFSENTWLVLVGIISYSSNSWQVLTNVIGHTEWIAHIVDSNQ
ncbi:probable threonine protease PRSS50 isoform X2 [Drosophila gunungcola]|uniref:probable threonine protease PRSS50 isoform X2 n=1 Tax=Drosophila gunungcola TaxID=103775 RepID=UPI0022E94BCE|nr:probable threonine protease PRSS50 isoform X2 [Drosophila gunungcola]